MRVTASLVVPACRWLPFVPALFCLACSGGGASLNPVTGKVLYKDQPATGALLSFHPEGGNKVTTVVPVGLAGSDGTFELKTGDAKGAAAGKYKVTVFWPEEAVPPGGKKMSTAPPEIRDKLKGAYSNASSSQISVEVKSGVNRLDPLNLK
jgi:hypothetical protein